MTFNLVDKWCCGGEFDVDKDNCCDVDTVQWVSDIWSVLNFQMNDQYYFGYEFEFSGTGKDAKFMVSVYADLDCDGVLSIFCRFGSGDSDDKGYDCFMCGSLGFEKFKEME